MEQLLAIYRSAGFSSLSSATPGVKDLAFVRVRRQNKCIHIDHVITYGELPLTIPMVEY